MALGIIIPMTIGNRVHVHTAILIVANLSRLGNGRSGRSLMHIDGDLANTLTAVAIGVGQRGRH